MGRHVKYLVLAALAAAVVWASPAGWSATGYSVASLKGVCIWLNVAAPTVSGQEAGRGPATILSPITFDGNGHVTLDYYINLNGAFSEMPDVQGTYTVDADGSGTLSYLSPASGQSINFDFYLEPDGDLRTIHSTSQGKTLTDWVTSGECTFSQ
jgi:hypothetical protein